MRCLKRGLRAYFCGRWTAVLVTVFLLLILGIGVGMVPLLEGSLISTVRYFVHGWSAVYWITLFSVIGLLLSIICQFFQKRWALGVFQIFICLVLCVCGIMIQIKMFAALRHVPAEGFDYKIPPESVIGAKELLLFERKEPSFADLADPANGLFQTALFEAWKNPPDDAQTVPLEIPSLARAATKNRALLGQYLACNPQWHFFYLYYSDAEGPALSAKRRMSINGFPHDNSSIYIESASTEGTSPETFDYSLIIHLEKTDSFFRKNIPLGRGDVNCEKITQFYCADILTLIWEYGARKPFTLSAATIKALEKEFSAVADAKNFEQIKALLPTGSIRIGDPCFELRKSLFFGRYNMQIWANPGESGILYLKAFEITKNTPLSAEWLKKTTNERIGWSDNPQECFWTTFDFHIFASNWGKPYAARIEIWFRPDSGQPERKLCEGTFKMVGYQRKQNSELMQKEFQKALELSQENGTIQ